MVTIQIFKVSETLTQNMRDRGRVQNTNRKENTMRT